MTQKKIVYYVAFPIFMGFLCFFSYQLGFQRGETSYKKEISSKLLGELDKTEDEGSKLTYYEDLHDEKNPIVEQVTSDQLKKKDANELASKPAAVKPQPTVTTPTTIAPKPEPSLPAVASKATENSPAVSVQVGAFTDLGKADELTDRLKNSGFDAYTKPVQANGSELFRVLVKSSKSDVTGIQSKLTGQGFKNTFVVSK